MSRRPRIRKPPVEKLKPKSKEVTVIEFVIRGNHRAPDGNPYPKSRLTKRQQWTDEAQDYVAWKNYVIKAFLAALPEKARDVCTRRHGIGGKPIPAFEGRAHMVISANYKNGRHPDTENVFGSIADSLFEDDNNLSGQFDFEVVGSSHFAGHTVVHVYLPDIF